MSLIPTPVPYSRQVKLNYPNKVLEASATKITGTEYWPYQNGSNDPWYEGSISKKFYKSFWKFFRKHSRMFKFFHFHLWLK